jgi:hypothetical protein
MLYVVHCYHSEDVVLMQLGRRASPFDEAIAHARSVAEAVHEPSGRKRIVLAVSVGPDAVRLYGSDGTTVKPR